MARYTGPKTKIARKFGEPIYGPDKNYEKRNYPPGQHGAAKRRKKVSEYGLQLQEKQKAKYTYGILERQFRNIFLKASKKKVSQVKYYSNSSNHVLIISCTVLASLQHVPLHVNL